MRIPKVFLAYRTKDVRLVADLLIELEDYRVPLQFWAAFRDIDSLILRGARDSLIADSIITTIQECAAFVYCLGSDDFPGRPERPDSFSMHIDRELEMVLNRLEGGSSVLIYAVRLKPAASLPRRLLNTNIRLSFDLTRGSDYHRNVFGFLNQLLADLDEGAGELQLS